MDKRTKADANTQADSDSAAEIDALRRAREKLESIEDEVRQFHPLLKEILPRLPNVIDWEYNQGPHEMGADFVLEVEDRTLGDRSYVGVVAKVGKVTQNTAEIERQISECELPRKFRNGKKEIRISSVWVINNSTISHNAKEKIHHNYAARSVTFIDAERLARLISKHAPYCWQDLPPALSAYLHSMSARVEELDRQASLLSSHERAFFIDLDVVDTSLSKKSPTTAPTLVPLTDTVPGDGRVTLIEAEMGAGKSKLIRQLVQHHVDALVFQERRLLPVMVSCRELVKDFDGDADSYVRSTLSHLVEDIENAGYSVLLLIDGLDEALESSDPATLKKILSSSAGKSWLKTVIAARPSPLLDSTATAESYVTRLQIRPLPFARLRNSLSRFAEPSMCRRVCLKTCANRTCFASSHKRPSPRFCCLA